MKPLIHVGNVPPANRYEDRPPRPGAEVLCGKIAGSTKGVLTVRNFLQPEISTELNSEAYYSIYLTRKGADFMGDTAFRQAIKIYGYWGVYLDGWQFKVCKKCLDSEEFGLLALATL